MVWAAATLCLRVSTELLKATAAALILGALLSSAEHPPAPSSWDLQTRHNLGPLVPALKQSTLSSVGEAAREDFRSSVAAASISQGRSQRGKSLLLLRALAAASASSRPRVKRSSARCESKPITASDIDYTLILLSTEQLDLCLSSDVLIENLEAVLDLSLPSEALQVLKKKVDEFFPSGIPEEQLKRLGLLSRLYTEQEISQWNVTTSDTLSALLSPSGGQWDDSQVQQLLSRYLALGGSLTGPLLQEIGGKRLCELQEEQIQQIPAAAIGTAGQLNISSCSQSKKEQLYRKAQEAFASLASTPGPYYCKIRPYLGGAPVEDLKDLASSGVINMDLDTFLALNPQEFQKLSVTDVKNLLGENLPELKEVEHEPLVESWVQRQFQRELDCVLGIGLQGGLPEPTGTASPAGPTSTTTATTPATVTSTATATTPVPTTPTSITSTATATTPATVTSTATATTPATITSTATATTPATVTSRVTVTTPVPTTPATVTSTATATTLVPTTPNSVTSRVTVTIPVPTTLATVTSTATTPVPTTPTTVPSSPQPSANVTVPTPSPLSPTPPDTPTHTEGPPVPTATPSATPSARPTLTTAAPCSTQQAATTDRATSPTVTSTAVTSPAVTSTAVTSLATSSPSATPVPAVTSGATSSAGVGTNLAGTTHSTVPNPSSAATATHSTVPNPSSAPSATHSTVPNPSSAATAAYSTVTPISNASSAPAVTPVSHSSSAATATHSTATPIPNSTSAPSATPVPNPSSAPSATHSTATSVPSPSSPSGSPVPQSPSSPGATPAPHPASPIPTSPAGPCPSSSPPAPPSTPGSVPEPPAPTSNGFINLQPPEPGSGSRLCSCLLPVLAATVGNILLL